MLTMAKIRRMFTECGTINEVAREIKMSPSYYGHWEKGGYSYTKVTPEQARALAKLFKCDAADIADPQGYPVLYHG